MPPPRSRSLVRFDVRAKLFLASVCVIAIAVLASYVYLSRSLEATITDRTRDDLFVRLEVVARDAEDVPPDAGLARWDDLADDLGARAHVRVTFISAEGRVLGDSEVPRARIASIETHRHRPEVEQALTSGRGSAARLSDTVHVRLLYVAAPMKNGAIARVALPLVEVERAEAAIRRSLLVASILALVLAAVMSLVIAQFTSRAIGDLTHVANAMARGDFDARAKLSGADELSDLGRALDQLAGSLSVTMQQLRAERDRVERILSGMQEGVLLIDASGRVAFVNPALRQMLLLGADCVGKTPFEAIHNDELEGLVEGAQATGATQAAELELAGLKPRRLLVRVVPLVGEPTGLLAVFVDVTDIRRLESMRRDFVANASHELRTPVTAVRSAAETLRFAMENDPEAAGHFLEIIERNAERLQHLVEDLLDLSRIESHEYRLTFGAHEIAPLVARVIDLFRERAEKKRIRLAADVPAELGPARVDPRAFEQVLTNLIDNALKYSPERTTVIVRARATERRGKPAIRLSVVDTGPGIEERHLPRLFERFYRVDTGRSRELGGTGLGLSIVKHLCDALGGPIQVESTVGSGTTFSFTLARADDAADAAV